MSLLMESTIHKMSCLEFDVRSVSDLNKLKVPYIDVRVPAYDMDHGSSCKQLGREPRTESNGLRVV